MLTFWVALYFGLRSLHERGLDLDCKVTPCSVYTAVCSLADFLNNTRHLKWELPIGCAQVISHGCATKCATVVVTSRIH